MHTYCDGNEPKQNQHNQKHKTTNTLFIHCIHFRRFKCSLFFGCLTLLLFVAAAQYAGVCVDSFFALCGLYEIPM